jgi:hypothetical protein
MYQTKLINILEQHYKEENLSRLKFISAFVITLLNKSSVNLVEIAQGLNPNATQESNYHRIQDFFRDCEFDYRLLALFLVAFLPVKKFKLCLDRTNWKYGEKNLNILVLAVAYKGVAIPVLWGNFEKRGNSNAEEIIDLIEEFVAIFGKERIGYILADREFIGEQWIKYLLKEKIGFYIRIRENLYIEEYGIKVKVNWFFPFKNKTYTIPDIKIMNCRVHVAGCQLANGEYLIVITNLDRFNATQIYRERWKIESLFSCIKTRGLPMESTHMTETEKKKKLMALVSIGFVWSYVTGLWQDDLNPIKKKKHGRKAKSIFRNGLDYIRGILDNITVKAKDFSMLIKIFFQCFDYVCI